MKKFMLAAAASTMAFASPAFAATTFDMDGVSTGSYAGSLTVADGPLSLTVTTEGNPGGFVIASNSFLTPNLGSVSIIGSNTIGLQTGQFTPLRFSFNALIDAVTFQFGDTGGDDDSPVEISAFDAGDVLLGTASASYDTDADMGASLSLNFAGASYFIASSGSDIGNENSLFFEISGITAAGGIPEPTTWAMLIFGFGAIGGALRSKNRRRQKKAKVSVSYA